MRNAFRWLLLGAICLTAVPAVATVRPEGQFLVTVTTTKDTSLPYVRHRENARVVSSMVWFHLACLSARLRMYPLAMKLFLRSAVKRNPQLVIAGAEPGRTDYGSGWHLTREEDSLMEQPERYSPESKMTPLSGLLQSFQDTTNADHYALVLFVKQPVFNKRKVFTGIGNVGHTFISLIRFNRDNTYLSRTFGFYPKKRYPLAASPLFPVTPGMFRDDAAHDWDEMAGRFITNAQFRSIVRAMESYSNRRYSLSKNNCTDFGLHLAALGGIRVRETVAGWPLGRGNNPAWTGQSILTGKLGAEDSTATGDIFITLHRPESLWEKAEK